MSFKLVDRVKKDPHMPARLKRVLEAYLSYASKDGTSVRPTERNVARRIGSEYTRWQVSRLTQELISYSLLVHDFNENGSYKTHAYKKHGVWAYVYHVDLKPLADPELIAHFKQMKEKIHTNKRNARLKVLEQKRNNLLLTEAQQDGVTKAQQDGVTKAHTDHTQELNPRSLNGEAVHLAHPNSHPSAPSGAAEGGAAAAHKQEKPTEFVCSSCKLRLFHGPNPLAPITCSRCHTVNGVGTKREEAYAHA